MRNERGIAVRGEAENPLQPHEAVILSERRETEDSVTYTMAFVDPEVGKAYGFTPGQFNMVSIWGFEEAPVSLCSAPNRQGTFDHTVKALGNLTRALAQAKVGDRVGVRGPYGTGWPLDGFRGRDLLVVAGGVGMAPLRSVVEAVLAEPQLYGRLTVVYGARTPSRFLFKYDFDRWRAETGSRLYLTVDYADDEPWSGDVGTAAQVLRKLSLPFGSAVALVVGPEAMMLATTAELLKLGVQPDRVYLSLERRMRCGVARCGHCFFGPKFVCREGPVFVYSTIQDLLEKHV